MTIYTRPGTGDPDGTIPERILGVQALEEVAAEADLLILTMPLTEASTGIVEARILAALPARAWLINVSRGPLVDEPALIESLQAGRIAGAVLDVFAVEPLPSEIHLGTHPTSSSRRTCREPPTNSSTTWSSRTSAATSPGNPC